MRDRQARDLKISSIASRLIVGFMTLFSIIVFLYVFLYFYPRNTVVITDWQVDKEVYETGDLIISTGVAWRRVEAETIYDTRLRCGSQIQAISYNQFLTSKDDRPFDYVSETGFVPTQIGGEECHLVTTAQFEVEIAPGISREYIEKYTSETFKVIQTRR